MTVDVVLVAVELKKYTWEPFIMHKKISWDPLTCRPHMSSSFSSILLPLSHISLSPYSPSARSGASQRKQKNTAAQSHKEEAGDDVRTLHSKDLMLLLQDARGGAREAEPGVVVHWPDGLHKGGREPPQEGDGATVGSLD